MAEEILGVDFEIHGGGLRPRLPAPRERDRPDRGRARQAARPHLDAQRDGPARGREDGEVGGQHLPAARGARPGGPRRARHVLRLRPLPPADRVLARTRWRRPAASVERVRDLARRLGPRCARADGLEPLRRALLRRAPADDFNTPAARAALFDWIAEGNRRLDAGERLGAGPLRGHALACSGSRTCSSAEDERRSRGRAAAATSARRPAPRGDFATADAQARRAARARLDGPRHARRRRSSCARRDRLRAQSGARGRGAGPAAASLRQVGGRSPRPRSSSASAARPTTRASAPRSSRTATPTRARCSRHRTRSSSRSTRCRTRTTSGAICRVAEVAGAAGVVIPERRSAEVTPAVCKASAARWSTAVARVPQPRRLARARRRRRAPGSTAPTPAGIPYDQPDYAGKVVLVLGARGEGPAPARRRAPATSWSRCRSQGRSSRSTCRPRRPRSCTESCNFACGVDKAP